MILLLVGVVIGSIMTVIVVGMFAGRRIIDLENRLKEAGERSDSENEY